MIAIIWIAVTVVLWGLIAWMAGSSPPDDGAVMPILVANAAIWPITLAFLLCLAPFLAIHAIAQRRRPTPKDCDHGQ